MLQKIFLFLLHPLKFRKLYIATNLGLQINEQKKQAIEKNKFSVEMKAIHDFYENEFDEFCKNKNLDQLIELQKRKYELTSYDDIAIPILLSLLLTILGTYALRYLDGDLGTTENIVPKLIYPLLGFVFLFYGPFFIFYQVMDFKKEAAREQLIVRFELEIIETKISLLLEEKIKKAAFLH